MLRSPAERAVLAAWLVLGCESGHEISRPGAVRTLPGERAAAPAKVEAPPPDSSPAARKRACLAALPDVEPALQPFVRSLCAHFVDHELPGLAVALVERGELVVHVELGRRCSDRSEPVGPATAFRLGSISKPITATLVLEQLAAGRPAALDETIAAALPGWPATLPRPSYAALLQHRSGVLADIDPALLLATGGDWRRVLAEQPAAVEPGTWHYSNVGYVVLGALLEAASGRDYEALVRARVGEASSITSDLARNADVACGHLRYGGGVHPLPVTADLAFVPGDARWLNPAGGLLASAEDLARFAATQLEPLTSLACAPLPADARHHAGRDECYGMGLRRWTLASGQRVLGHAGETGSFSAELIVVPERELALVMLANAAVDWTMPLRSFEAALDHL